MIWQVYILNHVQKEHLQQPLDCQFVQIVLLDRLVHKLDCQHQIILVILDGIAQLVLSQQDQKLKNVLLENTVLLELGLQLIAR